MTDKEFAGYIASKSLILSETGFSREEKKELLLNLIQHTIDALRKSCAEAYKIEMKKYMRMPAKLKYIATIKAILTAPIQEIEK